MKCDLCEAGPGLPGPFCACCSSILPLPRDASPFAIFGLPERFGLDEADLLQRYRQLSRQLHPDRFARKSPIEKRHALEWTTALNDALRSLRTPEARADLLLRRRGIDLSGESGAEARRRLSPDFLESVLEEREALFDARAEGDHAAAQKLADRIKARLDRGRAELALLFERIETMGDHEQRALDAAASTLARLRYDARFLEEAEAFEREGLE
ncbi:MAG: Fe-S protein assembly co-chaperone HscB [Myxococcales bacterium]|jgi:molecular chaperone HscB|nr:Fe-S protein assembly co-chaperone HscB [Myxococcales bacterium]